MYNLIAIYVNLNVQSVFELSIGSLKVKNYQSLPLETCDTFVLAFIRCAPINDAKKKFLEKDILSAKICRNQQMIIRNVRVRSINMVGVFSRVTFRHWLKAKFTWIAWNFNGLDGIQSTSRWNHQNRPKTPKLLSNAVYVCMSGFSGERFLYLFEFFGFFFLFFIHWI